MRAGNYQLIYSIFRNLVENTAKYAGDGSTATMDYSTSKDETHIFNYWDNGRGVAPEMLDKFSSVSSGSTTTAAGLQKGPGSDFP